MRILPPPLSHLLHRFLLQQLEQKNLRKALKDCLSSLGLVIILFVLTATPALAQSFDNGGVNPQEWLRSILQWIDGLGAVGILAFIAIYIVATIAFLPGSILTLGAGVLFGVVQGFLFVFVGATLGATLAFAVGRYLARGWVAQKIAGNAKFRAIDEAVGREGFKIVLLTRLSPVFPFNLLNYAFGITNVSLRDYVLGCIGMIPGTLLYVYLGSLAGSIARIGTTEPSLNPTIQWGIRILGLVATIAVTVYVTRIARKALAASIANSASPDEQAL